jgi:hypothetical protein
MVHNYHIDPEIDDVDAENVAELKVRSLSEPKGPYLAIRNPPPRCGTFKLITHDRLPRSGDPTEVVASQCSGRRLAQGEWQH